MFQVLIQARKMSSVTENLLSIQTKVKRAYEGSPVDVRSCLPPTLVAVSKTKPVEMIFEAYEQGQRHFGENYIQEIHEKSLNPYLREKCPDIEWHFIGNCQTNKVNTLMKCPNLAVVETTTSQKLAGKLNNQAAEKNVSVMVQINTSGEQNKNGLEPLEGVECAKYIVEQCPNLRLSGLMTIGNLGNSLKTTTQEQNPDFLKLIETRKLVADALKRDEGSLELSMGMSNDFEEAIRMGSTNVRVGSSIFGSRSYPTKPETETVATKLEEIKL